MDNKSDLLMRLKKGLDKLNDMDIEERIEMINAIRAMLSEYSPFSSEPVDCVQWVRSETVAANDYNPNSVAPPEMELLRLSIMADGYTQPIVAMPVDGSGFEVVDGFHRNRVGKECEDVQQRVNGYLPIVTIRHSQEDKADRMAATIRHNRARGKHRVDAMSEIVLDLKRRNWSDKKIAKQLGMDEDEVLRLKQISGIAAAFEDQEFSKAWIAEMTRDEDKDLHEDEIDEAAL